MFEGSFLFYAHGQTVKAKARDGAALGQAESYWQTEKLAHYNAGYAYSICFAKRTRQWAKFQLAERFYLSGQRRKLKDSDYLPSTGTPDQKYVLWPRGEGWDVRYLEFGTRGIEWLPIAEQLFADEPEAWQAAYGHWMNKCKTGIGGISAGQGFVGWT